MLKWDARKDEKSKHGKFYHLWLGPLGVATTLNSNTFILQNLDDENLLGGPINGQRIFLEAQLKGSFSSTFSFIESI